MSTLGLLSILMFFQACLLEGVLGQCFSALPIEASPNHFGCGGGPEYDLRNFGYGRNGAEASGAYGGTGTGDLDVVGELPVAGTTLVVGQVPILGAVQFEGEVPAGGVVSIFGKCGCDCNGGPLLY